MGAENLGVHLLAEGERDNFAVRSEQSADKAQIKVVFKAYIYCVKLIIHRLWVFFPVSALPLGVHRSALIKVVRGYWLIAPFIFAHKCGDMISLAVELLAGQVDKILGKIYIIKAVSERLKIELAREQLLDLFHTLVVETEHLESVASFDGIFFDKFNRRFQIPLADGKTVSRSFDAVVVIGAVD